MFRAALAVLLLTAAVARAGDDTVIDTMDKLTFRLPKEKGTAEVVAGKVGNALRFTFARDARGVFFMRSLHGSPAWDKAAGLSFWVKGDGTDGVGGVQFIYDDDYAMRYDFAFPIKSKDWQKVTIAWGDLVPVLPGPKSVPVDPAGANRPSKLTALWFGKWWYWGDYPAQSYAIDDVRLEPTIERDTRDRKPAGAPLGRVLAKLKAGEPVTLVTMGDSLTDTRHWANRKTAWPALLREMLHAKYKSEVTVVNPAIGGTQLRQGMVLIPRWQEKAPDLVTFCYGGNDWEAGMRGEQFYDTTRDAIDRVRRAAPGADVLAMTAVPSVAQWETRAELAEAGRTAARERNAGLADTERAFRTAGAKDRERLFVDDRVHLSPAGHALMAKTVFDAIEAAGR